MLSNLQLSLEPSPPSKKAFNSETRNTSYAGPRKSEKGEGEIESAEVKGTIALERPLMGGSLKNSPLRCSRPFTINARGRNISDRGVVLFIDRDIDASCVTGGG
jgi:hypothetical protein